MAAGSLAVLMEAQARGLADLDLSAPRPTGAYLARLVHEKAFEAHGTAPLPDRVSKRRSAVAPFGSPKQWLRGNGRCLLRQLSGARTGMALAVQAYSLKRAINATGARQVIELLT